jgi:uncharacterized membrane protein
VVFLKIPKKLGLFCLGGGAYVALELLWRGRSHYSMFLAGGTCFLLLGILRRAKLPLPVKAGLGALSITAVELVAGWIFNRDYSVWDYRALPFNFQGQICAMFTLLWIPVSIMAMALYDVAERKI